MPFARNKSGLHRTAKGPSAMGRPCRAAAVAAHRRHRAQPAARCGSSDPKAEGYTTEDLASAADGFSSVACLALSNKDCSAVTSQAAIDQWKSCEQSFGAKSQRWLLVNNDCARKWSNVEAGVAALTGLANSAGGGVVGLAYNPEGGDKHMIQTAIESIPNMKLAYSMGPSPSAGCPAAPQCSPTSRWTLPLGRCTHSVLMVCAAASRDRRRERRPNASYLGRTRKSTVRSLPTPSGCFASRRQTPPWARG